MKKPMRFVAVLSLFAMLVTAGFIAAAQVGDVAILPMPSQRLEGGATEASDQEAPVATAPAAPESDEGQVPVEQAAGQEAVVPEVEPAWTEEEIAALRELARERIAAREMISKISESLKGFWGEELSAWLDEVEEHAPSTDEMLDSVDTWLEDRNLPESARWFERWGEIVDAFADSTGIAVDDAKEIGREWAEAQRDLFKEIAEDVKELREELRSTARGTKGADGQNA